MKWNADKLVTLRQCYVGLTPGFVCKHNAAKAKLTDAQLLLVLVRNFSFTDENEVKFLFLQESKILDYENCCKKL